MSRIRSLIAQLGYQADHQVDQLRARLRQRLGYRYAPLQIIPYRTFGTAEEIMLAGRVLETAEDFEPEDDDTLWDNLEAMYRRFASKEVPGVQLAARYESATANTVTDSEGYFQATLHIPAPSTPPGGWIKVQVETLNSGDFGQAQARAEADVLIPPATATYGVISDIDDTVVVSHAFNLLKMARMLFLNNARTRMPFPGVAAFYQALQRGASGHDLNPIFYVSSSAWNVYDLLVDFMQLNEIPSGPLLLTDYGANQSGFIFSGHSAHKMQAIRRILDTYPHLPFILIGDSGQRDPEIYRRVVGEYPGRILAIYIRDVTQADRAAEIQGIRDSLQAGAVPMLLEADSLAAARHAAAQGYIQPKARADVGEQVEEDQSAPTGVEAAVEAITESIHEQPKQQP